MYWEEYSSDYRWVCNQLYGIVLFWKFYVLYCTIFLDCIGYCGSGRKIILFVHISQKGFLLLLSIDY